jgi:hypothetical protein
MRGAVRLHIGGVDGDRRINPSHLHERAEDSLPDVPSGPAIEAIVDRGAVPVGCWCHPNKRAEGPDLIILAGVSGSGKTAFLRQLKSRRLPDGLVLPAGAADWPVVQIEAGKRVCIQKMRRAIAMPLRAQGVIVHYDLQGRGGGPSDFEHDQARWRWGFHTNGFDG